MASSTDLHLLLTAAVDNGIVRIAPEVDTATSLHPQVKRIVQKEIGQQRTDDTALRRALVRSSREPSGRCIGARSHRAMHRRDHGISV